MSDAERAASADGMGTAGATPPPADPPSPMNAPEPVRGKRPRWLLIGLVALVVVLVGGGVGTWLLLHHTHQPRQVVLPFAGVNLPEGVAADAAGNVYVTDYWNNWVLKLPAGSNTPVDLPFSGLSHPEAVAVEAPATSTSRTTASTGCSNYRRDERTNYYGSEN
jgi:serine/threonine protein kinase, bacterial